MLCFDKSETRAINTNHLYYIPLYPPESSNCSLAVFVTILQNLFGTDLHDPRNYRSTEHSGGSYSVVMEGKVILVREIIPTRNNNVK